MGSKARICSHCGQSLDEVEGNGPCPYCGVVEGALSASIRGTIEVKMTAVASVEYSDTVSWETQWRELVTSYEWLTRYYDGRPTNNLDARRAVHNGCLAAWSLAEHLPNAAAADSFRRRDAALRDAGDLINTWKHGGRSGGKTAGRIKHDHGNPDGTRRIDLEFASPAGSTRQRDALELLRSCLSAWAAYLRDHEEAANVALPPA